MKNFVKALFMFSKKENYISTQNNNLLPNTKHTMFYEESQAFQPYSLKEEIFKRSIINDHCILHEVLTVKNDNKQHFNYRQPSRDNINYMILQHRTKVQSQRYSSQ